MQSLFSVIHCLLVYCDLIIYKRDACISNRLHHFTQQFTIIVPLCFGVYLFKFNKNTFTNSFLI